MFSLTARSLLHPALLGLFLFATGGAYAGKQGGDTFCTVLLSAAQEVQTPPVNSNATGTARFQALSGGSVLLILEHTVLNPTAAHFHPGAAGANSPPSLDLGDATSPIIFELSPVQFASITASPHYINVHSAAFPEGEIRGQVVCETEEEEGCANLATVAGQLVDRFEVNDRDSNGTLSVSEAATAATCLEGEDFQTLDLNGDGALSAPELRTFITGERFAGLPAIQSIVLFFLMLVLGFRESFRQIFFQLGEALNINFL